MGRWGSCSFASLHDHLEGAALGAARIVVNAQNLVRMDLKCVGEVNKIWRDAALSVRDRHHAGHAVSCLNRGFQCAAFQWRAEGETIKVKETGGPIRRFGSAESCQNA